MSVIHAFKGPFPGQKCLDGRAVKTISAFLFHHGSHEDPARLSANSGKSFLGTKVYGMGFTFDDTDVKGVATPLAEMRRLVEMEPSNEEVIYPFVGGEEVNTSPSQAHHRYVINFGERSEAECRQRWPDLFAIVEAKVKPERMNNNREVRKRYWWRFGETTPALFASIAPLRHALVISSVCHYAAFALLPSRMVFSHALIVFPFQTYAAFCVVQSRPHEMWARFFGSSMKDDLRYTPSDCFETFPFPDRWAVHSTVEVAGEAYYKFRATLMAKNEEGLTKTYNRFHDPDEVDPQIAKLRDLHTAMDRAVLDAYGWTNIPTTCEFLLDYEIDEEEWGTKKKPWRYRWPDEVRDEVLARLLELNAKRAREEELSGAAAKKAAKKTPPKGAAKHFGMENLFS